MAHSEHTAGTVCWALRGQRRVGTCTHTQPGVGTAALSHPPLATSPLLPPSICSSCDPSHGAGRPGLWALLAPEPPAQLLQGRPCLSSGPTAAGPEAPSLPGAGVPPARPSLPGPGPSTQALGPHLSSPGGPGPALASCPQAWGHQSQAPDQPVSMLAEHAPWAARLTLRGGHGDEGRTPCPGLGGRSPSPRQGSVPGHRETQKPEPTWARSLPCPPRSGPCPHHPPLNTWRSLSSWAPSLWAWPTPHVQPWPGERLRGQLWLL